MRLLTAIALVCLASVTLAGCSTTDPLRYPTPVSSSASHSASGSASASVSGSASASATGTSTGPAGNGTVGNATNHAPTANITVSPANGTAPLNVTLTLSGTDADNDTLTWKLLFGDGNVTNGTTLPTSLVHRYAQGGNYTPTLTVTDGRSNTTASTKLPIAAGSVGTAPALDPACQGAPQATLPPAGAPPQYYIEVRAADQSQWVYQESNNVPGLQYTNQEGTAPVAGSGDFDPMGANCLDGDTLIV
jgi:PKD repeat protein